MLKKLFDNYDGDLISRVSAASIFSTEVRITVFTNPDESTCVKQWNHE